MLTTTHLQIESDPTVQEECCCPDLPVEPFPTPEQLKRDAMLDAGFDPFVESPEEYIRRTNLARWQAEVDAILDEEIPTLEEVERGLVTAEEIRTEAEWLDLLVSA